MEKKNYTWKLSTELVDKLQKRAEAENRNLTNFIECIFMAATNTPPMIMQSISCEENVDEGSNTSKAKVVEKETKEKVTPLAKRNTDDKSERIRKAKEALEGVADNTQKERKGILKGPGVIIDDTNKDDVVYVTDENVKKDADGVPLGFFVTYNPEYKFDGRTCSYQNRKGEVKKVLITDEMVALGSRRDCIEQTFARFNDKHTYKIVMKYLEDHPEERVEEESDKVISSSVITSEKKDEFDNDKF